MNAGKDLATIHSAIEAGVNDQDIDGLMSLYAADATMVVMDGSVATGLPAIREEWLSVLAMNGHIKVRSRYLFTAGDLAILSNEWMFEAGSVRLSSVTAEVVRRQPGGGWLYIVDHPFAGSERDELAAMMSAVAALPG
jgi:ketosteroid isomerase-like protein